LPHARYETRKKNRILKILDYYLLGVIIKFWKFGKENRNLANLGHFFHEKSFVQVKRIFFR
jgi:hypothetical protein